MNRKYIAPLLLLVFLACTAEDCEGPPKSSDRTQAEQQERILQEGTSQVGMPAIVNFRERKLLKDILELRDQEGLVTYTYIENMVPTVVHGHTVLGGKLTFYCVSVGYGIPYATQFTNPQKIAAWRSQVGYAVLPQADPNGLFSPASAEGTWVLCADATGKSKDVRPEYIEPRIVVSTFQHPLD